MWILLNHYLTNRWSPLTTAYNIDRWLFYVQWLVFHVYLYVNNKNMCVSYKRFFTFCHKGWNRVINIWLFLRLRPIARKLFAKVRFQFSCAGCINSQPCPVRMGTTYSYFSTFLYQLLIFLVMRKHRRFCIGRVRKANNNKCIKVCHLGWRAGHSTSHGQIRTLANGQQAIYWPLKLLNSCWNKSWKKRCSLFTRGFNLPIQTGCWCVFIHEKLFNKGFTGCGAC